MKKLLVILLSCCAFAACNSIEEEIVEQNTPIRSEVSVKMPLACDLSLEPCNVSFAIGADAGTAALSIEASGATRAEVGGVNLGEVWIFQFSSQGLMFHADKAEVDQNGNISATFTTGLNQIIYVVANAANMDFSKVSDLSSFENLAYPSDKITNENEIPLVGKAEGVDIEPNGDGTGKVSMHNGGDVEVTLKRIASKIVFRYKFDVTTADLTEISLVNAPAIMSLTEPAADGELTFYPEAIVATNFTTLTKTDLTEAEKSSGEVVWYISDNIRGSIAEYTEEKLKNRFNAPERSTYACLSAKSKTENTIYHYQFYLGADNCGNYNVFRNNVYTVTAKVNDCGVEEDYRIETEELPVVIVKNYATPANSYIVAPGGEVVIGYMYGVGDVENRHLKGCVVDKAEVVWQTKTPSGELMFGADALTLRELDGVKHLVVKTNPKATEGGNALVAIKDAAGKILWSWHIWVTSYNPEEENCTYGGNTWMNRALGALSGTQGSWGTAGLYYQWGRKDPFPSDTDNDMTNFAVETLYDGNGVVLPTVSESVADPQIAKIDFNTLPDTATSNVEWSIANPTIFICNPDAANNVKGNPVHWVSNNDDADAITASLWNLAAKGDYDPCPAGWMVSPTNIWSSDPPKHNSPLYTAGAVTFFPNDGGSVLNRDDFPQWLKCSGCRKGTDGAIVNNDTAGQYWTAEVLDNRSWMLLLKNNSELRTQITYSRAMGANIRCVKEPQE